MAIGRTEGAFCQASVGFKNTHSSYKLPSARPRKDTIAWMDLNIAFLKIKKNSGIQEHTFLLQTAIDEAKKRQGDLTIAFGSIPCAVLEQLWKRGGPPSDRSATGRWIIPHHLQPRQRAPRSIGKGRPGNGGLDLDKKSKDVTHLLSSRSSLSFTAWSYWAKLRVNGLAVRGAPGSTAPDKLCRFCRSKQETTSHVVSACPVHLPEMTGRHDRVQQILTDLLWDQGIEAVPNTSAEDGRSIPDVTVVEGGTRLYIDVTVPFDDPANLYRAAQDKLDKYGHLGTVFPLVVGALGSWLPENDRIPAALQIPPGKWNEARRRMRASAIEDSCRLAKDFLHL
ncbi:hypothetical protein EGW08_017534 [Elysia chlorotica]|uniref:Reverse transcriptase zinc-binding domain-containing protein n=1 Tax=Elysia chlorotica TaxID=188477 RepID=A0A3S0ZH31_ELYCH|nr:hypothetical protein EGW08_017534 [Elysia chlorotica]